MSSIFFDYIAQQRNPSFSRAELDVSLPHTPLPINAQASDLFEWRRLKARALEMLGRGRRASGPDRMVLKDLTDPEINLFCREIVKAIKRGDYRSALGRMIHILKMSGGTRTILIQNAIDNLVASLLQTFLTPHLDPQFYKFSFGGRPGKSVYQTCASLVNDMVASNRRVIFEADIKEAFDHVRITTLFELIDNLGLSPSMARLTKSVVLAGREFHEDLRGIPQGNPISMILMNLYLHHSIDPILESTGIGARYCDNVVLLPNSKSEGRKILGRLRRMLNKVGLRFKKPQIVDLREQDGTLFNLSLTQEDVRPRFKLTAEIWSKFSEQLRECCKAPVPVTEARQRIRNFLRTIRLCLSDQELSTHLGMLRGIIEQIGLLDELSVEEFTDFYREMVAKWQTELLATEPVIVQERRVQTGRGAPHHIAKDTFVHFFCLVSNDLAGYFSRSRSRLDKKEVIQMAIAFDIRGPPRETQ